MSDDPLDDLLTRAFADDRAQSANIDVASQVMGRIRARRRLRRYILGGAVIIGLGAVLAFLVPAVVALTEHLMPIAPELRMNETLLMMLATLGGAAWLLLMEENAV